MDKEGRRREQKRRNKENVSMNRYKKNWEDSKLSHHSLRRRFIFPNINQSTRTHHQCPLNRLTCNHSVCFGIRRLRFAAVTTVTPAYLFRSQGQRDAEGTFHSIPFSCDCRALVSLSLLDLRKEPFFFFLLHRLFSNNRGLRLREVVRG